MLQRSCQQAHDEKAHGSAKKNDSARVPRINATQNAIESAQIYCDKNSLVVFYRCKYNKHIYIHTQQKCE